MTFIRKHSLAAIILVGAYVQASAQDAATVERMARESLSHMLGTISVEAKPQFRGGELWGCALEFGVLAQDWVYKQGAYIRVGSLFGIISVQGKLAVTLRATLHDFDPRTMGFTPSTPASAVFISGTSTTKNAVVESSPSDIPGSIFVIFHFEQTFAIIAKSLIEDRVTIGIARTKGGTDIPITIDTSVVDTAASGQRTRSPKAVRDFGDCASSLVQQTTK